MRLGAQRLALFTLSVLTFSTSITAATIPRDGVSTLDAVPQEGLALRDVNDAKSRLVKRKKSEEEAKPFDGKDGIPKNGPWVETSAERTRKKSNDEPEDPKTLHDFKKGLSEKDIPRSNDAVMDDPGRKAPKEGTRGTEGGVSEKTKQKEAITDDDVGFKKPKSPKKVSEASTDEELATKGKSTGRKQEDGHEAVKAEKNGKKLEKPADLPEKPHSIPHPENPSSPQDPHILSDDTQSHTPKKIATLAKEDEESGVIQPFHSLVLSFAMIIVSEIGDKTFLVACLMAMRHDRILVFTAAFSALITMTVLSAVLGHAVPTLIPKAFTNFLAAGLFLVFGVRMMIEARRISPDEGVSEEMKEVEMELEEKEQQSAQLSRHRSHNRTDISPYVLEAGRAGNHSPGRSPTSSASSSRSNSPSRRRTFAGMIQGINNLFSLLLSPAWVQTFVMTFLGEWGDRSQIATIAMAAGQDYWWVTAGALGGHAICTGMAVIGGKAIAGRVSLRTVTMGGAIAFLVFGVIYLLEAVY